MYDFNPPVLTENILYSIVVIEAKTKELIICKIQIEMTHLRLYVALIIQLG